MTEKTLFYRWWPAVLTALVGWALAGAAASLVGSQVQDHDTRIVVCFVVGIFCGWPVGLACIAVYDWRNRW